MLANQFIVEGIVIRCDAEGWNQEKVRQAYAQVFSFSLYRPSGHAFVRVLERIDEQLATFGGPDLVLRGERRLIATSIGGRHEKKPHLPHASPFLYTLFSPYPSQKVGDSVFHSCKKPPPLGCRIISSASANSSSSTSPRKIPRSFSWRFAL